jgi:hypothetical protein
MPYPFPGKNECINHFINLDVYFQNLRKKRLLEESCRVVLLLMYRLTVGSVTEGLLIVGVGASKNARARVCLSACHNWIGSLGRSLRGPRNSIDSLQPYGKSNKTERARMPIIFR